MKWGDFMNRREFLKLGGSSIAILTVGGKSLPAMASEPLDLPNVNDNNTEQYAVLTDVTKCVECKMCQMACQSYYGLNGGQNVEDLSPEAWTFIRTVEVDVNGKQEKRNVRNQCFHCLEPACASACPVGALYKEESGPVVYEGWKCIGCRYCMTACPFGIPRYEWDSKAPLVTKCIMCFQRLKNGQQPVCTAACPSGATTFGKRSQLVELAQKRLKDNPTKYIQHIYGLHEAGGTSFLYISDVPFKDIGFREDVTKRALPDYTWDTMSKIPAIVVASGLSLVGAYSWTKFKTRVEGERGEDNGNKDTE